MASPYIYSWKPLTCWHCEKPHSTTQDFCNTCNGWTLPIRSKERSIIEWKTFVVKDSDSKEVRERLMKDVAIAIGGDKFIAVLGFQLVNDGFGQNLRKTAVFLYRPGGDKRLSISRSKDHASSRSWHNMNELDWEAFKQIVGTAWIAYSLPDSFPKPKHLCFCDCHIEE